jgi:predicted nucleic acid-binding protein
MKSSDLPASSAQFVVADASVIINLNATGKAKDIISILPHRVAVTSIVLAELSVGAQRGHDDARKLQALVDDGNVDLVELGGLASELYASLVEGAGFDTLDDGEAATIAYAYENGGIAAIDERKARRLCAGRFPGLQIVWTVDLLLHESVALAFGRDSQADAVFDALQKARMQVPREFVGKIINLIGKERAALCRSLPKTLMKG